VLSKDVVVYMNKKHKGNASTPKRATPCSGSHMDSRLHWRQLSMQMIGDRQIATGRSREVVWMTLIAEDSGWQIFSE
jgi:hypothetical protein